MLPFAIGKKIKMSQLFSKTGQQLPVTEVEIVPGKISLVRSKKDNGYSALQIEIETGKEKKMKREYRILTDDPKLNKCKVGDKIEGNNFSGAKKVDVSGFSKGKGFQGVIKRHNFSRGPMSHGSHHHRSPGAIGQCEMPARVFKGKKMPGRMGGKRTTLKNLELVKVDGNKLYLKGGVPGSRNSYVAIRGVK